MENTRSAWFDTWNVTAETGHVLHFSTGASGPEPSFFSFFVTGAVRPSHAGQVCNQGTRFRKIEGFAASGSRIDLNSHILDFFTTDTKVSVTFNRVGGSAGGGGSHNHSFSGTAINLAVQYCDVMICVKDA